MDKNINTKKTNQSPDEPVFETEQQRKEYEDKLIEKVALQIFEKHRKAFEELAK